MKPLRFRNSSDGLIKFLALNVPFASALQTIQPRCIVENLQNFINKINRILPFMSLDEAENVEKRKTKKP